MNWLTCLVALIGLSGSATLAADEHPTNSSSVVLHYPGVLPFGADDAEALKAKTLELLRTSNFNSATPVWKWAKEKVDLEYGKAVAGRHLVISFERPEEIETVGGKLKVKKIVVGLNEPQYASSLHTIDENGQVVGHEKYSGLLAIELLDLARVLPNKAIQPTR